MEITQSTINDFVSAYINNVTDTSILSSGEATPIAIDILDCEGHICYANQKCIKLYGLVSDYKHKYTVYDLAVHEKHRNELKQHIQWLVSETPKPTPYIGLNKTLYGEVIHVRVHWDYIMHKHKVLGFISVITNLSENIPNLERYRANEAFVHAMVQTILCGVMIMSAAGEILEINNLCSKILNRNRNNIIGYMISDFLQPVSSSEKFDWAQISCSTNTLVNEYCLKEKVYKRRRYVLIESASSLVYKGISAVVVFVKDVTNQRLEAQALAAKTRAFEQQYRQTLMTEMISGLAHEINQPLAAIANYTKGCMRRLQDQAADPAILQSLEMVVRQTDRASNILKHMRQWNSAEQEPHVIVDIKDLVLSSVRLLEFDLQEAKIELNYNFQISSTKVYGCPIQLEQVLINLLRNAIEAINQRRAVEPRAVKKIMIEVLEGSASMVDVIIKDSGIGILESSAEHLFEPFFTTKVDGMGIGLALSEKIIQDHGGRLSHENLQGEYQTAFILNLPLHAEVNHKQEGFYKKEEMMGYSAKVWSNL